MKRDVFICHASEDKGAIARPLAEELTRRGWQVWFDEFEIELGDSLRQKIDAGLAVSRFGVVILSESFFKKDWPQRELDGLVARETSRGEKVVLPIWHEVDAPHVAKYSPLLAGRLAAKSDRGLKAITDEIESGLKAEQLGRQDGNTARSPRLAIPSNLGTDTSR
jgi:TIR domain